MAVGVRTERHRRRTVLAAKVHRDPKASDLAEVGWDVTAHLLGRTRSGWKILEMGNVYPG